jgi:hypothetical protein
MEFLEIAKTAIPAVSPTFSTVQQFPTKYPAFTKGGLRHLIFNEEKNGLKASGAIIRMGRKVLIHEDKFFAWVEGGAK